MKKILKKSLALMFLICALVGAGSVIAYGAGDGGSISSHDGKSANASTWSGSGTIAKAGPAVIIKVDYISSLDLSTYCSSRDNMNGLEADAETIVNQRAATGKKLSDSDTVYSGNISSGVDVYGYLVGSSDYLPNADLLQFTVNSSNNWTTASVTDTTVKTLIQKILWGSKNDISDYLFPYDSTTKKHKITTYVAVLKALAGDDVATNFKAWYKSPNKYPDYKLPVITWTVGFVEKYSDGGINVYQPSQILKNIGNGSAWTTGYSSVSDFMKDVVKNKCTVNTYAHVYCRAWLDGQHNHGHERGWGVVASGGSSQKQWCGTQYVKYNSMNYYARGYFGVFNCDEEAEINQPNLTYYVTSTDHLTAADFTDKTAQESIFTVHLDVGKDTSIADFKKKGQYYNDSYNVTITVEPTTLSKKLLCDSSSTQVEAYTSTAPKGFEKKTVDGKLTFVYEGMSGGELAGYLGDKGDGIKLSFGVKDADCTVLSHSLKFTVSVTSTDSVTAVDAPTDKNGDSVDPYWSATSKTNHNCWKATSAGDFSYSIKSTNHLTKTKLYTGTAQSTKFTMYFDAADSTKDNITGSGSYDISISINTNKYNKGTCDSENTTYAKSMITAYKFKSTNGISGIEFSASGSYGETATLQFTANEVAIKQLINQENPISFIQKVKGNKNATVLASSVKFSVSIKKHTDSEDKRVSVSAAKITGNKILYYDKYFDVGNEISHNCFSTGDRPTSYTFSVLSSVHEEETVLTEGEYQNATFALYLGADNDTLEAVNTSASYTVVVQATPKYSICDKSPTPRVSGLIKGMYIRGASTSSTYDEVTKHSEAIGTYVSFSASSSKGATSTYKFTVTGTELKKLLKQQYYIDISELAQSTSKTEKAGHMSAPASFTVTINSTSVIPTDIEDCSDAYWCLENDTNNVGHSYNDWVGPDVVDHIDWTFSTTSDIEAYAEIVANCAGTKSNTYDGLASDWNVSEGIPSTENLAVAAGGRVCSIDLSGRIHAYGQQLKTSDALYKNNKSDTQNAQNKNAAITRTIKFKVTITDIWASSKDSNARCTLSCPGHTLGSKSQNVTEKSGTADANGLTNTWSCDTCGATGTQSTRGGVMASATGQTHTCTKDGVTYSTSVAGFTASAKWSAGNGEQKSSSACAGCGTVLTITASGGVDPTWGASGHTCNYTVTFNCSTGDVTASGDGSVASKSVTAPTSTSNKQRYLLTACSVKIGTKTYSGYTYTADTLTCDGYTAGYGCTVTHATQNIIHPATKTFTFSLVETVDVYAYRELLSAKVYTLERAEIASVNTSLISSSAVGQASSNTNISVDMWKANGDYNGSNGRVWFTKFKSPQYKSGDGWTSTTVSGDNGAEHYWLGNCTISMTVVADNSVGTLANSGAIDSVSISKSYGKQTAHWNADSSHGNTNYQSKIGDVLTDDQALTEALHVVNAWECANSVENGYTANIISDAMSISVANVGSQNILAESYAIDSGINLFNFGFTENGQTYYRNHANKYGTAEELQNTLNTNVFWDKYDDVGNLNDAKTLYVGYTGHVSSNPSVKYSSDGIIRGESFIDSLSKATLSGYVTNGEKWSQNSNIIVATCYSRTVPITSTVPGRTNFVSKSEGTAQTQTFNGYYTTFAYPNIGSFTVNRYLNGSLISSGSNVSNNGAGNVSGYTNTSDGSTINYCTALVISNISMIQTAKNGVYTSPIGVNVYYNLALDFSNQSLCQQCVDSEQVSAPKITADRKTEYVAKLSPDSDNGVLNDVLIHDPVSSQYSQLIGNGYGDYDGNGPAEDETGEDMRVSTQGVAEANKNNYVVIGNTVHLWITDFGDFYDAYGDSIAGVATASLGVGCTYNGADSNTGKINSNAKGYTNNMNTGRWVAERDVMFTFPVIGTKVNGDTVTIPANTWINLSEYRCNTLENNTGSVSKASDGSLTNAASGVFHGATDALQNALSSDSEFKYGLDYSFQVVTSAEETTTATVTFATIAINAGSNIDFDQYQNRNITRDYNLVADNTTYCSTTIEVVGRIGNLALEDVGDFRYSELFKKALTSWSIPNVVHNVDSSYPVKILTTTADIMLSSRGHTAQTQSHATLSVTNYRYGSITGLGKAGEWGTLPLTAASLQSNSTYSTEQLKIGYASYFDIETIGNYYGINTLEGGSFGGDDGPSSVADENSGEDTRTAVMTITPHYYLYDYSEGKFYAIDLYAGSSGSYTLYYSDTSAANVKKLTETGLSIDLTTEAARRNTTSTEESYTDTVLSYWGINKAAYKKYDYIGTASKIVLDCNDLDYIGSSYLYGDASEGTGTNQLGGTAMSGSTGNGVTALNFMKQSQRWYFTLNLPSSTIATYAGAATSKTEVLTANQKLKNDHPNSVIVAFAGITVQGSVYELEYDARLMNGGKDNKITLYSNDNKPDNCNNNTITVGENGVDVYSSTGTVVTKIDSKWAPLVVYDAYNTSTTDLTTTGTH